MKRSGGFNFNRDIEFSIISSDTPVMQHVTHDMLQYEAHNITYKDSCQKVFDLSRIKL